MDKENDKVPGGPRRDHRGACGVDAASNNDNASGRRRDASPTREHG